MDAFAFCVYLFLSVAQISGRLESVDGDTITASTALNVDSSTAFKPLIAPLKVLGISVIKASESHTQATIISTGSTTKASKSSVVSNAEVTTQSNEIPTAVEALNNDDLSIAIEAIPTVESTRDDVFIDDESLTSNVTSTTVIAASLSNNAIAANSNLVSNGETLPAGEDSSVSNDIILPVGPGTEAPTTTLKQPPVPKPCNTSRGVLGSCVHRRYCDYGTIHIDRTLYAPRSYQRPCNDSETCCPSSLQLPEEPPNDIKEDKIEDFDDEDKDF